MSSINAIAKQSVIPFSEKKEEVELSKIKLEHMLPINVTIGTIFNTLPREKNCYIIISVL